MNYKIILFALVVLNVQLINGQLNKATDCKCRLPTNRRIVGGEVVGYPIPWAVSLHMLGRGHFCGGTILNKNYIMSAAHCIYQFVENPTMISQFRIRVGISKLNTPINATNTLAVKRILYSPNYDPNNPVSKDDISLIELEDPIENFSNTIQPACLPKTTERYTGRAALNAVGWGSIKKLIRTPDGQTPAVVSNDLKHAYFTYDESLYPGCDAASGYLVCVNSVTQGDSICAGDSGTGLLHNKGGITRVVGIVQFGPGRRIGQNRIEFCYGPGGFGRVSTHIPKIQGVLGNDYCSKN